MVGLGRLELPTSPLSGVRSDQLSYRPNLRCFFRAAIASPDIACQVSTLVFYEWLVWALPGLNRYSLKEVIQPQVPLRLPCYDFTLVADHTVETVFPKVKLASSGAANFHGVTGGVYKARERIHRSIADLRLLAIPTSCSRVADYNPDWDRLFEISTTSRLSHPLYLPL